MMRQEYDGGVWAVEDRTLTLDIPKLLDRLGLEDTPENHDLALKATLEATREMIPNIVAFVVVGDSPRRWGWEHE